MARSGRILVLIAAALAVTCLLEGATAAQEIERPGRQLTQLESLWPTGKPPNHPVLYSGIQFHGDMRLRLKVGVNKLSKTWVGLAKSLWIPDGYEYTLHYKNGQNKIKMTYALHKAQFTAFYLGTAEDWTGKIVQIDIKKIGKFPETVLKMINQERSNAGLAKLALNDKLSKQAYDLCQANAHAGSLQAIDFGQLSKSMSASHIFHHDLAVIREIKVTSAFRAVVEMYKKGESLKVLQSNKWHDIGVGYAQHHLGEEYLYACVIFISH